MRFSNRVWRFRAHSRRSRGQCGCESELAWARRRNRLALFLRLVTKTIDVWLPTGFIDVVNVRRRQVDLEPAIAVFEDHAIGPVLFLRGADDQRWEIVKCAIFEM